MSDEIRYPSPEVLTVPGHQPMSMRITRWPATSQAPEHFSIGWLDMTTDQVAAFGRQLLEITGNGPRTWLYGLTADEWLHLAAEGQDSEVAPCCGDIGGLREILNELATDQEPGGYPWMAKPLTEAYEAALSSHDTLADEQSFPLLHRVLAGVRARQAAWEQETPKPAGQENPS